MKILILNGPNLNLLGRRDKSNYGSLELSKIEELVRKSFSNDEFVFFQSNSEGDLIDRIQIAENEYDAIVINPGGYAHTSVAIRDALAEVKIIKIEVHLSNLSSRDSFRQTLITASVCEGYVSGFKENSYLAGIYLAKKLFEKK